MKLIASVLALAIAATGTTAAPGVQERQAGVVYVQFFAEGGCQGDWREDTVYFDDGTGSCEIETYQGPYASWRVVRNEAIHPLRLYSNIDCTTDNSGNVIEVPAGDVNCFTQPIGSTQFVL